MAWTVPWNLIGLGVAGDVGGLTVYTDRFGRKVAYPKSPPDKPPSDLQIAQRTRFREAQAAWSALDLGQKLNLELAVMKSSICMTGQNLYITVALKNDQAGLDTIARQTDLTLPQVPFIP